MDAARYTVVRVLHHDPGRYATFGPAPGSIHATERGPHSRMVGRSMYETDSVRAPEQCSHVPGVTRARAPRQVPAHWVPAANGATVDLRADPRGPGIACGSHES